MMRERKDSEWGKRLKNIISREIAIEYKVCLYFACILFFYSAWLILGKSYYASIWMIWKMILTAYAVGYMQVYLFQNFDEAERIGKREGFCIILCSGIYTGVSWGFGWFDREPVPTLVFGLYMMLCYLCVFLSNKFKRDIDTKNLNRMLEDYKRGAEHE